jgi:rhodanese-related sulfurtransferase
VASGLALDQNQRHETAAGYDEGLAVDLPFGYDTVRHTVERLTLQVLRTRLEGAQPPVVLFVDSSRDFSSAHVPGADWLSRSWLKLQIEVVVPDKSTAVVVTCATGPYAVLAGATLTQMGYQRVAVMEHGTPAWR